MCTIRSLVPRGCVAAFGCVLASGLTAISPTAGAQTPRAPQSAPRAGKVVEVKMIGDASGFRFEPASVTVKTGDVIRWTLVSGPPHNVAFWTDSIPRGAAARLGKNMSGTMGPLMGPMFMKAGDTFSVSFAGLPKGAYHYNCTPHLALGMRAVVRVE